MDGLEESRKKKRDISGSEVGSERGLGGVMYDETMRMYVPKVSTKQSVKSMLMTIGDINVSKTICYFNIGDTL